jgi:hypothetical protein
VVNDLDVLTGAVQLSVQWAASEPARQVRLGDRITVVRPGEATVKLTVPVSESRADGLRHKLLLAADPAAMSRLRIGDEVRVFPFGEDKK